MFTGRLADHVGQLAVKNKPLALRVRVIYAAQPLPSSGATAHGDIRRCSDVDVRTELKLQGHVSGSPPPLPPGSVSVWFVHQQSGK